MFFPFYIEFYEYGWWSMSCEILCVQWKDKIEGWSTFAAASEAAPPCLKSAHGSCLSMYKFPALPISTTASQADDRERFS